MTGTPAPAWIARTVAYADRLAVALAWISGATLVGLALFVTAAVLGRRFGGPYTGATDEISVFLMALAGTWALAYTSAIGKHIRIDLTLHWFPPRARRVVDFAGVALLAAFAALLAINSWTLAWDSWVGGSVSMSRLSVPLFWPQAAMATGFTVLAAHSFILLLVAPWRDLESLHEAHRGEADSVQDI